MADSVQQMLEGMLPELEDFQKRGIFNGNEVKGIIARRRHFEYLLHSRSPNKIDYLRYVEYELNLDRLRRLRKSRLGIKKKNTIGEHAITRRIFGIFDRALRRFPGDISIWKQYIDMARSSRSYKAVSRIFGRALQLHPLEVSLWISAASWEFTHENNMQAARALLQRGLRVNPGNVRLYLQLIRLELLYMLKLQERKRILSLPKSDDTVIVEADDSDNEDTDNEDEPRGKNKKKSFNAEASVMSEEFFQCAVPRTVYHSAISEIPDNLDFRVDVLRLYQQFEGTEAGQKDVCESLERDFPENESLSSVRARCRLDALPANAEASLVFGAVQEAIALFDIAVEDIKTAEMFDYYSALFEDALSRVRSSKYVASLTGSWAGVCERAIKQKLASPRLLTKHIYSLLQQCKFGEALKASENAVSLHTRSVELWLLYCKLVAAESASLRQPDLAKLQRVFVAAVTALPKTESASVWRAYIDTLIACNASTAAVEGVILQAASSTMDEDLLVTALNFSLCSVGIDGARRMYRQVFERVLKAPLSFFTACVAAERAHGHISSVRELCERACALYGATAEDLWLEYALAETASGHHDRAHQRYNELRIA